VNPTCTRILDSVRDAKDTAEEKELIFAAYKKAMLRAWQILH
jgi:hypothetical protein